MKKSDINKKRNLRLRRIGLSILFSLIAVLVHSFLVVIGWSENNGWAIGITSGAAFYGITELIGLYDDYYPIS